LTTSFTKLSLRSCFLDFAQRNSIPHLDNEGYFEERPLSTRSAVQAKIPANIQGTMKRPAKPVATDRSFVVALARGLEVLRAFHPNDGLLGNQEIAARTKLPKPTISRLTYTLTKLGYLTQVPRFEKYQLAPAAMALGYAALANLGVRHLSESFREEVMRETGGAVAVGGRDRLSMIYFGQSRNGAVGVQLDVGSRVPIATTAMGRAYLWALQPEERAALLRELREHYGSRWPRYATASNDPAKWSSGMVLRSRWASGRTTCTPPAWRSSSMTEPDLTPSTAARRHSVSRKSDCAATLDLAWWRW
jgi:hypothetical protein